MRAVRWVLAMSVIYTLEISAAEPSLRYTLSPVMVRDSLAALAVELRFHGDADGETVLRLPDSWGGKSDLYRGIRGLSVTGADVDAAGDTGRRILRHAPGAALVVRYRVVQYWEGEPAAGEGNEYRPVIRPGYFHVVGNAVFAHPERNDDPPVEFRLGNLPRGWRYASDLEHARSGRKLLVQDVIESVVVAGDFRIMTRGALRVATRGDLPFVGPRFLSQLDSIITSHHRFFGDPPAPFLVTVLPLQSGPGQVSVGGTSRDDAFAFFATDNADPGSIRRLLAHEHLHTWIPGRLGAMPEQDQAGDYWLSEGFTDFYARRLLLRDGSITLEDFVADWNGARRELAASPARDQPNARIVADFWNDGNVNRLPYLRGDLLATFWDARLRAATDGARDLDDVLLAMKAEAAGGAPARVTQSFAEQMRRAGVDVSGDLARYVERGETPQLPEDACAPCGKLETVDRPEFHRGFDVERTTAAGNVVTGLDPESPAYRAGLREGMKILERTTGEPGNSRVPYTYRVQDGQAERMITFLPEGKSRMTFQQLALDPSLAGSKRDACIRRLSGSSQSP